MSGPLAPCIVWQCHRPTVDADGLWCALHAPESALALQADADALAWLTVGEGLTLAEIEALTA